MTNKEKLQAIYEGIDGFQTDIQDFKADLPKDKEKQLEEIYQYLGGAISEIEELMEQIK